MPAHRPELNPFEHLWDKLESCLGPRSSDLPSIHDLTNAEYANHNSHAIKSTEKSSQKSRHYNQSKRLSKSTKVMCPQSLCRRVYTHTVRIAYFLIILIHHAHSRVSTFTSASLRSLVSGAAGFPSVQGGIAAIV